MRYANQHSPVAASVPSRLARVLMLCVLAGAPTLPAFAADAAASVSAGNASRAEDTRCIRDTGTHLRQASTARRAAPQRDATADAVTDAAAGAACNGQPGSSYSRADIERTGATSIAEALRLLDPAVH